MKVGMGHTEEKSAPKQNWATFAGLFTKGGGHSKPIQNLWPCNQWLPEVTFNSLEDCDCVTSRDRTKPPNPKLEVNGE